MNPFLPGPTWVDAWSEVDGDEPRQVIIGGPEEGDGVIPCPALIRDRAGVISVAYQLDEIEVARLACGGVLWLHTWGRLPVHLLEILGGDPPARRVEP